MHKNVGYFITAGLGFLLAYPANICIASLPNEDNKNELFFIIHAQTSTVVVTTTLPDDVQGPVMRLPDLASDAPAGVVADMAQSRENTKLRIHAIKAERLENLVAAAPLKFKAKNIVGTVKLPKVKFGNFRPGVNLREEMPSIDFTSKSLKDGGL
jgi:hypothetical protein